MGTGTLPNQQEDTPPHNTIHKMHERASVRLHRDLMRLKEERRHKGANFSAEANRAEKRAAAYDVSLRKKGQTKARREARVLKSDESCPGDDIGQAAPSASVLSDIQQKSAPPLLCGKVAVEEERSINAAGSKEPL